MKLTNLISDLKAEVRGPVDIPISSVEYHSGRVKPGCIFAALPGFVTDGRKYAEQAVALGAVAVLFEGPFFDKLRATQIRVSGVRLALAKIAAAFYAHPTGSFYLAGITGTNGKTTITYLLEALWQAVGRKTGVIGTVTIRHGSTVRPAGQTTPESRDLQEHFAAMRTEKVDCACIEASSHALSLSRVEECDFDSAVFTNLTQDHLDFHSSMEAYFEAKKELFFRHLKMSSKKNRLAIICSEDEYGRSLIDGMKKEKITVATYGIQPANDMHPALYTLSLQGIQATLNYAGRKIQVRSPLMGRHNLLNIMAALMVGYHSGLETSVMEQVLAGFKAVPGRMERIDDPGGRLIFVDYAHTPDAIKNVLEALRLLKPKKIITVFGCGGDRDPTKRPKMGYEAALISDVCVVTSDNPRTEDPEKILAAIVPGVEKAGMKKNGEDRGYLICEDRREAIGWALNLAKKGEVVLIAGKGHEGYQIIGTTKHPFSDQQVVREFLQMSPVARRS